MLKFEEYAARDATGLAELVSKREVTPAELLETAISRTEEVNPELNAVVLNTMIWLSSRWRTDSCRARWPVCRFC